MYRGLVILKLLLLFLFISLVPLQSDAASLIHIFRQLAAGSRRIPNPKLLIQMSPSPSPTAAAPASGVNFSNHSDVDVPETNSKEPVLTETCDKVSKKCQHKSLTACLGLQGLFLLVLNDDDSSLKVNVTFLPSNVTYKEMDIPRHQAKKINISDNVRGSSSIVFDAESGGCIIHMGADVPKDNFHQLPSFDTYITPINGVYLLLVSVLIIGGTLTCFTLSKRKRHLDGIPYQELEMGQSELVSSVNVETAEGWDQDWDDDWDEEKAVKSPAGNHVKSRTASGHTSRSNSDGWGNDWDD